MAQVTTPQTKKTFVLAFDIEKSGGRSEHPVIAIGASVVDENLREHDSLFLKGYIRGEVKFEARCWNEFWSNPKNKAQLETFIYKGPLSFEARQKEMIETFQAFRAKWEKKCAEDESLTLLLVSDNNVYDGGFINDMIFKHMDGVLPIPYTASSPQIFGSFFETHSQQKGLLMKLDPSYQRNWGLSRKINSMFHVPVINREHDHNPANDAYVIACEQQILFGISSGKIHRKL